MFSKICSSDHNVYLKRLGDVDNNEKVTSTARANLSRRRPLARQARDVTNQRTSALETMRMRALDTLDFSNITITIPVETMELHNYTNFEDYMENEK